MSSVASQLRKAGSRPSRTTDRLPGKHPTFGTSTTSPPTCTGRRRYPGTTATPVTSPNPSSARTTTTRTSSRRKPCGITITRCTSPRRTCIRGWPRNTTCTTSWNAACCPPGHTTPDYEFDVGLMVSDIMFQANGSGVRRVDRP
jgi:hypothetical protein